MIHIYKLKYSTREEAINDLINKGIYTDSLDYGEDVIAVADLGLIPTQFATFDQAGNILTEQIYSDGYHFDILVNKQIDFGANEIFPTKPRHVFSGYES